MDREKLVSCFHDTLKMCDSSALSKATEKAKKSTKVYKENYRSEASKSEHRGRPFDSVLNSERYICKKCAKVKIEEESV